MQGAEKLDLILLTHFFNCPWEDIRNVFYRKIVPGIEDSLQGEMGQQGTASSFIAKQLGVLASRLQRVTLFLGTLPVPTLKLSF